jgi:hypothetical protein
VLRRRRSSVALPAVPPHELETAPAGTLGQIVVPGKGKKLGETIALTAEQYRAISHALTDGYLSEAEAMYRAGRLPDYDRFPAGRLVKGKARPQVTARPMHRATAVVFFHELEMLAGVHPQPKRGWHGLRRVSTDVARRCTTDARVLNAQGAGRTRGSAM